MGTEMGSPAGDPTTFAMEKYGAGVAGSDNANIGAFVTAQLNNIGGWYSLNR